MTPEAHLRVQFPNSGTPLATTFKGLFAAKELTRVRIAVAFARWDGIGLIADELEGFLAKGGSYQSIFGVENQVTTPDALLHCIYLQSLYKGYDYAGAMEPEFRNSLFHTKLFEFRSEKFIDAFIGSANLTGGGLERNTELVAHIRCAVESDAAKALDQEWQRLVSASVRLDLAKLQNWSQNSASGKEGDGAFESPNDSSLPILNSGLKGAKKPFFKSLLGGTKKSKTRKVVKAANVLTQKPSKLYLEILAYETGGSGGPNGSAGYQVQLPVAVLSAYFGVGVSQSKEITIEFANETITTKLTHFSNNTHRMRLKPILKVKRPNILIITRDGVDAYRGEFVAASKYAQILKSKCTEQSRPGARRWGLSE